MPNTSAPIIPSASTASRSCVRFSVGGGALVTVTFVGHCPVGDVVTVNVWQYGIVVDGEHVPDGSEYGGVVVNTAISYTACVIVLGVVNSMLIADVWLGCT